MLARALDRNADLERLVKKLWSRIEEQQILLNSALHELADAKREPGVAFSRNAFISRWYRKHHAMPRGGR